MYLDQGKVRQLRLERGWTQQQLADACGLSTRTIQRIEKDGVASLETTSALVAVFEVPRSRLLFVSPEEAQRRLSRSPLWPLLAATLFGMAMGVTITVLWF